MGFELPAAMGAKVACPGDAVWCIAGDGGFQMTIQELATIVQEKLAVKIAIMNNGYLGMVRQWQELFNESRYSSTCLMNCTEDPKNCRGDEENCRKYIPDFVKVAEAYGAKGIRVKTPGDLDKAIQEALKHKDGPYLIDILTEREENVWPMVPAGASLDEMLKGGMTV